VDVNNSLRTERLICGMITAHHYRKLAEQARRLAHAMYQPDVIEVLRSAAREYDALAERFVTEAPLDVPVESTVPAPPPFQERCG
jgi:hypothetical protein